MAPGCLVSTGHSYLHSLHHSPSCVDCTDRVDVTLWRPSYVVFWHSLHVNSLFGNHCCFNGHRALDIFQTFLRDITYLLFVRPVPVGKQLTSILLGLYFISFLQEWHRVTSIGYTNLSCGFWDWAIVIRHLRYHPVGTQHPGDISLTSKRQLYDVRLSLRYRRDGPGMSCVHWDQLFAQFTS